MAELVIHRAKLVENITALSAYFRKHRIEWSLIVKILSGNKRILREILVPEVLEGLHSIGDSRLSGLRAIKEIDPNIRTVYIKPPAVRNADKVVRWADVSLNSSYRTIEALDGAARNQGKVHQVIIMIELGELREGVLGEKLLDFYTRVFELEHIRIAGLGTNLGCLFGVEPTRDKLIQLSLYKQLIEARFGVPLEFVSGGTSITLPLIDERKLPAGVNHFRVGEAAFMGTSPLRGGRFKNLHRDVFEFAAHILEFEKKDRSPDGLIGEGNVGHTVLDDPGADPGGTSSRAIVDFGLIDVNPEDLSPLDSQIRLFGSTSDMTVFDLLESTSGEAGAKSAQDRRYQVGQTLSFIPNYMAVARLMSTKFVDKIIL